MKTKFGTIVPGQMFEWNSQQMVRIHLVSGVNVWDGKAYGFIPADVEVESFDEQIRQNPLLMEEVVELPKSVYDAMCDAEDWLASLEEAGVDNWEGYDESRRIYSFAFSDAELGMTLRDYFAASCPRLRDNIREDVKARYEYADAMLAERAKGKSNANS